MSDKQRISKALSMVLPGGAVGASLVLAASAAQASMAGAPVASDVSVADRLQAIRTGVNEVVLRHEEGEATEESPFIHTWWGNGGWGRWNLGWGNGGWRNGWHNWPNWHNGWNNWGNGWHNFWNNA